MELQSGFALLFDVIFWGKIYRYEKFLIIAYQKFYLMILGLGDRIAIFSVAK